MNDKTFEEKKEKALKGRDNFALALLIIPIITLLLFYVPWTAVNNATPGNKMVEIPTNGFHYLLAGLLGEFKSADKTFGDVASYYYWMKDSVTVISIVTIVAAAFLALNLIFSLLNVILDKTALRYLAALTLLLATIALIATFIVCMIMLPKFMVKYGCNSYCAPLCLSIIPAIAALIGTALSFVYVAKRL